MFLKRSAEVEIMDDLQLSGDVIDWTLKELHFINTWLGGNNLILEGLKKILSNNNETKIQKVLKIADLGCGGGDIMMHIAKWARKNNLLVELTGIDANPNIISYAKNNTKLFPEIKYLVINVFSEDFKKLNFDIFTCTLFCHHFEDDELIKLLKQLRANSNIGVIINDLHRHWFAYYSINYLTKIFSRSSMVIHDAKTSVLRAFLKKELKEILIRSEFKKFNIKWKWAFRYLTVAWK